LTYGWPQAEKKAKAAAEILEKRALALGLKIERFRFECVGVNALSENPEKTGTNAEEVMLRVSAYGHSEADLNRFGMEIAPLVLTGPSTVTGFAGGRPKASEVVAYWPALLKKEAVSPRVQHFSN
jgi:hypothetical protein